MHTIFTNLENSKTSNPHRLLLHLEDKINLKRSDIQKYCTVKSWDLFYIEKNKNNKVKLWQQDGMKYFNCMGHIV